MSSEPKTAAPTDSAPNTAPAKQNNEVEYNANVPVDLIIPDPKNRDKIDPEKISTLADSIADVGLLQPVVLRVLKDGKYMLIAGEHRWRAYKKLKLPTIAARIYRNQTELEAAKRKAAENALRVDLTPIEKAKRYQELQQLGASQKEIGSACGGVSQPVVANALRLLTLPTAVQELISAQELSEAHGVSLARFSRWPRLCSAIARLTIKASGWSTKDLNREKLPFHHELEKAGLIEEINVVAHAWSNEVAYKIPDALPQDDFIKDREIVYYILPENPKDNIWAPEKAKQDAARAAAEKAEEKKVAASIQGGRPSREQLERKKKLDDNKRNRTTITVTLAGAVSRLLESKEAPSTAVQVVFENSVKCSYLDVAARMLCIKLPATEYEIDEDYESRELTYKKLHSLGDDKLLRLAACTVMLAEASDAQRFAGAVPACVEHIAAGKLVVAAPDSEELKKEKPDWVADVEKRLEQGYTAGELAKEYADRKDALVAIKAIKKALVSKKEQQAVIDEASKPKTGKVKKKDAK